MKTIGAREFEILDKQGYIIHRGAEKNYTVINRNKKSARKKYAVVCNDADPQRKWKDLMYVAIRQVLDGEMPPPYAEVLQQRKSRGRN